MALNDITKALQSIVGLFVLVIVGWFLYKKVDSAKEESDANKTETLPSVTNLNGVSEVKFNMFDMNAYNDLRAHGYTVILLTEDSLQSIAEALVNSGLIFTRDDDVIDTLKRVHYKTQVSQLCKRMDEIAWRPLGQYNNVEQLIKGGLSSENQTIAFKILNDLSDGYSK